MGDGRMRILVVEDEPVLRRLLVELIDREEELEAVGAVETGERALHDVSRLAPDLVVLDLHLPDLSGIEVMSALDGREEAPDVLVVSGDDAEATQIEVARAGARGFVPKAELSKQLADAIRSVGRGETWYSAATAGRILLEYRQLWLRARRQHRPLGQLTERELAVLMGIARGQTNSQIAQDLQVSVHTVKARVRSILRKLKLPTRTEAAVFAAREDLLERSRSTDP
jgi:DNA-binding NarL/FixJ family response regulator